MNIIYSKINLNLICDLESFRKDTIVKNLDHLEDFESLKKFYYLIYFIIFSLLLMLFHFDSLSCRHEE